MRGRLAKISMCLVVAAAAFVLWPGTTPEAQAGPKPPITTPTITCAVNGTDGQSVINVTVCAPAGGTGIPAGFSVQWMTCAAYEAYGWDETRVCKASFSGNASGSTYNLAAGSCSTVYAGSFELNAPQGYSTTCPGKLECDTCYVFRAFGHATSSNQRSDFTANTSCTTDECNTNQAFQGCTKSQGYFGNTVGSWGVSGERESNR